MTAHSARIERVRAGERRALGQLCRALEELREPELRTALYAAVGAGPRVIGVTGAPGVGKSTLLSALTTELRALGQKVGIVAIDPSSPLGGGALLGDRIRMQQHHADDGVFIHSVATHGASGGLSQKSHEIVLALGLWGADVVLVETVGVGQAELAVMHLADTTCVVLAPGLGDDLQANKAGLMEIADVFVVNKADLPGAARVVSDVQAALALTAPASMQPMGHGLGHGLGHTAGDPTTSTAGQTDVEAAAHAAAWTPPVLTAVASKLTGMSELVRALDEHRGWLGSEVGQRRRLARRRTAARDRIAGALVELVQRQDSPAFDALVDQVAAGTLAPERALKQLLQLLRS